jgi:hypothetical protein
VCVWCPRYTRGCPGTLRLHVVSSPPLYPPFIHTPPCYTSASAHLLYLLSGPLPVRSSRVVVLLRTKLARGDIVRYFSPGVLDNGKYKADCAEVYRLLRSLLCICLQTSAQSALYLPLSNTPGEKYRIISTGGTAHRRELAIKAARLSAPGGEMRAQGSKGLLVVKSIDPRSTVRQYVVCTIEGGETLNVPQGELPKA